ncbi:MAG: hypothetical protein JWN41_798 [Thermoleophilia bacterium]|nr:hypothetical protein [Thermoleophilia bacterium]
MDDGSGHDMNNYNDDRDAVQHDHDQVGTVEVQILLSWFFETAVPGEFSTDIPRAA